MRLDEGMVVTVEGVGKFVVTTLWETDTYLGDPPGVEKLELVRFRGEYKREEGNEA